MHDNSLTTFLAIERLQY